MYEEAYKEVYKEVYEEVYNVPEEEREEGVYYLPRGRRAARCAVGPAGWIVIPFPFLRRLKRRWKSPVRLRLRLLFARSRSGRRYKWRRGKQVKQASK